MTHFHVCVLILSLPFFFFLLSFPACTLLRIKGRGLGNGKSILYKARGKKLMDF